MSWEHFIYFAIASVLLWAVGAWSAWRNRSTIAYSATILGLLVFFAFILLMWISLERPPLRTMGETRLWYSFFLPLAGLIVYSRWKYKWILSFSTILALVFICVNLFKPEIHDKTLMPALQSPWFAPHVIVYMFAYAVLGAAAVMAIYLLFIKKSGIAAEEFDITDNLVYVGLAFLTIGMLFPKETWAAITWLAYLIYVHYRQLPRHRERLALWILIGSFVLLQMCWWGINYLPSAQGSSVHTYNISD